MFSSLRLFVSPPLLSILFSLSVSFPFLPSAPLPRLPPLLFSLPLHLPPPLLSILFSLSSPCSSFPPLFPAPLPGLSPLLSSLPLHLPHPRLSVLFSLSSPSPFSFLLYLLSLFFACHVSSFLSLSTSLLLLLLLFSFFLLTLTSYLQLTLASFSLNSLIAFFSGALCTLVRIPFLLLQFFHLLSHTSLFIFQVNEYVCRAEELKQHLRARNHTENGPSAARPDELLGNMRGHYSGRGNFSAAFTETFIKLMNG